MAEEEPGGWPDAADRSKHVEGGRPAGVVAEDARQQRADDGARLRADEYRVDDERAIPRRRPSGDQRVDGRQHRALAESGQDSQRYQDADVDSRSSRCEQGCYWRQKDAAAVQPSAAETIGRQASRHLHTEVQERFNATVNCTALGKMHRCIGLSAAIGVRNRKSMTWTSLKLVADTPLRQLTLTLTLAVTLTPGF